MALGLRHLVVVNEQSHVQGIITRKDLDYAAGKGAWRRNKQAPKPSGSKLPRRASIWGGASLDTARSESAEHAVNRLASM